MRVNARHRRSAGLFDDRYAVTHVLVVIIALEILTFWSYAIGFTSVNGDANAHYLADAYAWWNRGGIMNPPQWLSYAWMGRPAGSNLQDGSYVLPVGIANAISPWSPQVSALTSAVLAGLGAFGMYILVRRMFDHHWIAVLASIGQFFAPGIFANAQFLDFHRGAAYLPWLLLVASPLWFWHRRWGLPLAAVILWQVAVGIYPGQLVAGVLCVGAWTAVWAAPRLRASWLWRLMVAGCVAAGLSVVKFAPALLQGTGNRPVEPQRLQVGLTSLSTLIYPYDDPAIPSDIALRPFFIVAPLLLLAVLARPSTRHVGSPLAMGIAAVVGIAAAHLPPAVIGEIPGFGLSRVIVNDFRTYLIPSLVLLGAAGARQLTNGAVGSKAARRSSLLLLAWALLLALPLSWERGLGLMVGVLPPLVILGASALVLWWWTRARTRERSRCALAGLGALAALSGLFFAYSVTSTWASPGNVWRLPTTDPVSRRSAPSARRW